MAIRRIELSYVDLCRLILLLSCPQGIGSTTCTDTADLDDFTNVLSMCNSGTMTAGRVVVDTCNTGVLAYDSCQCDVRQANAGSFDLQIDAYPGTAPAPICGSILRFTRQSTNASTVYGCQQITGNVIDGFTNNDILKITLSRSNSSIQWQSGHCIFIQSDVNVTCENGEGMSSFSGSVTTTTTTTTATTTPTTTTTATTTTTTTTATASTTTEVATNRTGSGGGGDDNGGDDILNDMTPGLDVIAGAAGGGVSFLIIIIIIIVIVIVRKKRSVAKEADGNLSVDIQPYAVATPKFYHNDGFETLPENSDHLSGEPHEANTSHIVTKSGDLYAQVQTKHKCSEAEHSNSTTQETMKSPSGDVYAVVNKSEKQKNIVKDELQTNEVDQPSRCKNQDGLVYAELETSRPQSRPPVRPKPTPEADTVIYSEVHTGV
ncbi:activating signal cointegrator 1 complex subunit 2 homolog [Ylistrum balloti]|uniref:activating signal cointegrator 1 complex subunit 2 homolog n=1 Tax=Ylistrum balloti TaxID=509963 RepID=UPI002905D506|nr:activating signal cointegrator 1 complex subunit 2 homolog [Ylistrum balloti]